MYIKSKNKQSAQKINVFCHNGWQESCHRDRYSRQVKTRRSGCGLILYIEFLSVSEKFFHQVIIENDHFYNNEEKRVLK